MESIQWGALCLVITIAFCSVQDTYAKEFRGDTVVKDWLRIIYVEDSYMLIGAQNIMYNISSDSMSDVASYNWIADATRSATCRRDINILVECESYVRTAVKKSANNFIICGSSAKSAECRSYSYQGDVGWILGNEIDSTAQYAEAFTPIFPWHNVSYLQTARGVQYTANNYYLQLRNFNRLFRNETIRTGVPLRAMISDDQATNQDLQHKIIPNFVKMFDTNEAVYMMFTEPALETFNFERMIYTRVARVCQNDNGTSFYNYKTKFATFFKARMLCGLPEAVASQSAAESEGSGFYSFYFNELADATSPVQTSDTSAGKILAIFNTGRNSIGGSAICTYSVADIETLFNTSPQLEQRWIDNKALQWTLRPLAPGERPPARCPNNSAAMDEQEAEKIQHPLLYQPVLPIGGRPIFLQTNSGYRFTQMVVDWKVQSVAGDKYDIIFVSTDHGHLLKLVPTDGRQYKVVEDRIIFSDKPVGEMRLIRDDRGKGFAILNTFEDIKKVSLEICHRYDSCSSCVGAQDPYCAWNSTLSSCVYLHRGISMDGLIQDVATGNEGVCPQPKLEAAAVTAELTTTTKLVDGPEDPLVPEPSSGAITDASEPSTLSTNFIVLLVVLPIAALGLGFGLGYFLRPRCNRSGTPHLDSLAYKKEEVLKADTDCYQIPHKHNNVQHQFTNNLNNGKLINNSTDSICMCGESTLQRQKKVYV